MTHFLGALRADLLFGHWSTGFCFFAFQISFKRGVKFHGPFYLRGGGFRGDFYSGMDQTSALDFYKEGGLDRRRWVSIFYSIFPFAYLFKPVLALTLFIFSYLTCLFCPNSVDFPPL